MRIIAAGVAVKGPSLKMMFNVTLHSKNLFVIANDYN
jgi:hypothetical protein